MIKFLIDENISPAIVEFLVGKGFDVLYARECELSGKGDSEIITLARDHGRTLVTFDKHFANVLLYPLNSHHGIIRIRIHPPVISYIVKALQHLLKNLDLSKNKQTLIV